MRKLFLILTLGCLLWGAVLPAGADGEPACAKTAGCTLADGHEGLCNALCDDTSGCVLYGGHEGSCVTELVLDEDADIDEVLAEKDTLVAYLEGKYPGYHYAGGDITLKLAAPEKGYSIVTVGAQLNDGTLTLLGAEKGATKMESLIVNAENVCVDGITFTGATCVTVNAPSGCEFANCSFKNTDGCAIRLQLDGDGSAPLLTLTQNTFDNVRMISLLSQEGSEIGQWWVSSKTKPATAVIDFTAEIVEDPEEALYLTFPGDISSLVSSGWTLNFLTDCDYRTIYTSCEGVKTTSALTNGQAKLAVSKTGQYIVVNGSYPTVSKNVVKITEDHCKYLKEVTVNTTYTNATVTRGSKKVLSAINNKKLTFQLNGAGSYTITEVKSTSKTTATTKTTSTSRKSGTSSANAFLVTPQRFSDAMRYVSDNVVTLNCTEAGKNPVSLPVESMGTAAAKGLTVAVKTKSAELRLDAAALKSLAQQAKGDTVLLQYESLNHKSLSSIGQASLKNHLAQNPGHCADLAFQITVSSDSETIEDLQQGTITLKIPFIVLPGTEDLGNVVYALQGESASEARDTTVEDGYLTTTVLDLTEHMVFQVNPLAETSPPVTETETVPETTGETIAESTEETTDFIADSEFEEAEADAGFPLWIPMAAVLVLAGGGAAAWFLYFQKRIKK